MELFIIISVLLLLFTPVGGTLFQLITAAAVYAAAAFSSIFSKTVRKDMAGIRFNPFNRNEENTLKSKKISFYRGSPVIRFKGRSGAFGIIFLDINEDAQILRHESGHNRQLMMMGLLTFAITVAIPSIFTLGPYSRQGRNGYYHAPWEAMADVLGGADHEQTQKTKKEARQYYLLGHLIIPSFFKWKK